MAENAFAEQIVPGVFVRVQAEALIAAGGISAGNIAIVGTAAQGNNEVHVFSDYASAKDALGAYDASTSGTLNLVRALEQVYLNGGKTVYCYSLAAGADQAAFTAGFNELVKENIQIVIAPELTTDVAKAVLGPVVNTGEDNARDMIAVIGCDDADADAPGLVGQVTSNKRFIMTAPGLEAFDAAASASVTLGGNYSAAVVAGLISSLSVQTSPTNKVLSGVTKLAKKFSYSEQVALLNGGICPLEDRKGIRVVRGLTTQASENGPFSQITTRRIVDFAKAGIRQVSNPFIGRLNNERVRKALRGSIDGFLTTMLQDESLTGYTLEVTATRQDEIAGRAIVNVAMQPTFSIDYIRVTLALS